MLVIRLMRTGKIHAPHYRVVVQEKRSKLNGKAVDTIGHYHPAQADKLLVLNKERAQYWLSKGAQPSDTVTNLFVKDGILTKSHKVTDFYTVSKKEEAPAPAPVAEAAPAPETPAAEEVTEEVAEEATEEPAEEVTEAPETAEVAETTEEEAAPATEENSPAKEAAPEADSAA